MSIRAGLFVASLFLLPGCTAAVQTAAADVADSERPNVIVIMADDIGYECYSCYGSTSYETPVLDAMADRAVRFTHCYSQPLCTPSRVKIMTGRSNARNYRQFGSLPATEIAFGRMMRDAGYRTCVVGKWQLAGGGPGVGTEPDEAGFDEHCLWAYYHNLSSEDQARYNNPWQGRRTSRYWKPCVRRNGQFVETTYDDYGPDIYSGYLLDFIERNQDRPFFAYYPMALVHDPFVPTPHSECMKNPGAAPVPKNSRAAGHVPDGEKIKFTNNTQYYTDMVAYMDEIVGRILAKLEETGLSKKTIVLVTGDNGTNRAITSMLGDVAIRGGKGLPTDAGTRVALFAEWKGVTPAGVVCDDLVDFNDFMATIADATGATPPQNRKLDGVSFLPQLRGEKAAARDWLFCHYEPSHTASLGKNHARFARDKRWKLYWDGRLIDVENDVLEESPILPADDTDETAALRARLQSVLQQFPQGNWNEGGPQASNMPQKTLMPVQVVNRFHEAMAARDKAKALEQIVDLPSKEQCARMLDRVLEDESRAARLGSAKVVDSKILENMAVVIVSGERPNNRHGIDVDALLVIRIMGVWKLASGITIDVARDIDFDPSNEMPRIEMRLQQLDELEKWYDRREAEIYGAPTEEVFGTLTLDGCPLAGATVTFIPTTGGDNTATAVSDAEGKYRLLSADGNQAIAPGTYKVVISKKDEVPEGDGPGTEAKKTELLPARYANLKMTELRIDVPGDGAMTLDFSLVSQ